MDRYFALAAIAASCTLLAGLAWKMKSIETPVRAITILRAPDPVLPQTATRASPLVVPDPPPPLSAVTNTQQPQAPAARYRRGSRSRFAPEIRPMAFETIVTEARSREALAANDHKNPIQDPTEAGFVNGRRPTADDLPLIDARLQLLERLGPSAVDIPTSGNYDQAYKDLLDQRAQAAGN